MLSTNASGDKPVTEEWLMKTPTQTNRHRQLELSHHPNSFDSPLSARFPVGSVGALLVPHGVQSQNTSPNIIRASFKHETGMTSGEGPHPHLERASSEVSKVSYQSDELG